MDGVWLCLSLAFSLSEPRSSSTLSAPAWNFGVECWKVVGSWNIADKTKQHLVRNQLEVIINGVTTVTSQDDNGDTTFDY